MRLRPARGRLLGGVAAVLAAAVGFGAQGSIEETEAGGAKATAGDLVESFGNKGRRLDDLSRGKRDVGSSVAVQPNGKILVGGWAKKPNGVGAMAVVRYDRTGRRDQSFGSNGVVKIRRCFDARSIDVRPGGKILLAGNCELELGLVRLRRNGELDPAFGNGGVARAVINGEPFARDIVVGPDGKITVAGDTQNAITGGYAVAMARFLPNGELDTSFSGDGHLFTTYGEDTYARGYGVDLQSDGKAIVVGEVGGSWILSRFTVDGQIDTSFGVEGVEYRGPVSVGVAHAVEVLADDRILAAGEAIDDRGFRMAAVRSFPNGETDTSFGDEGSTQLDFGKGDDGAGAYALARDSKGRIVMAGYMLTGRSNRTGRARFGLARMRANGRPDRSFGGDGTVQTSLRPNRKREHRELAEGVAIAANDDPIAAGYYDPITGGREDIATVRYRSDREG